MRCNLIVEINELTVRDYTLVEDEGLSGLVPGSPGVSRSYEDDEESPGKNMMVIKGIDLNAILKFLSFAEIPVRIIAE